MNELKLAQFKNISNSSNNIGYEFLKRSDNNLNYSIFCESTEDSRGKNYTSGYSYLHYAAKNFDLASINELIKRKVDLVQQGHEDGCTALHIVSDSFECEKSSNSAYESVMSYVGKLKKNIFVKTLLDAQREAGVTRNPKSTNGTSHLHIACMYNHVRAVQLFLNAGESIDHATNDKHELPGYTALHFAIRYSSLEAAEILLNHGANIFFKDFKGESSLDCLIVRMLDVVDFLAVGKRAYFPFYEEERDRLESILNVILNTTEAEDISDDSGLTWLHVRCIMKDSSTVKGFFRQNMDVNCAIKKENKLWAEWTPLHFAACFNVETFKFLLLKGADLNKKNAKGKTPLDFCMQRYSPYIVHSILSTKGVFRNILFSDGKTKLLDVLLNMTNDDVYIEWLEKLANIDIIIPSDSPIWPGYNLLYLVILNERITPKSTKLLFEAGQSTYRSLSVVDDEQVEYWKRIMNYFFTIHYNFKKNNALGLSPFHFALSRHKITSVKMILNALQTNVYSNGLSYFHCACAMGNMEIIERLYNGGLKLNRRTVCDFEWYAKNGELICIPANSTPLHVAVIFQNETLVEYLLEKGANLYVRNDRGFDPIQLALMNVNHRFELTKVFLRKIIESGKFSTEDCLHCLHMAALIDDKEAMEKLLKNNVNCEVYFELPKKQEQGSKSSIKMHIAVSHRRMQLQASYGKSSMEQLLLNSITKSCEQADKDYISKMKEKHFALGPINETGVTTLHFACSICDVDWAGNLLKKGADPNCRVIPADDLYYYAHWYGGTPLIICAGRMNYSIDQASVTELFKLLIEYGADVTIMNDHGQTPLHVLYDIVYNRSPNVSHTEEYKENILSTIDLLLRAQKSYYVNPTNYHGLSHFHMACFVNNMEVVEGMLEAGVSVNQACEPFAEIEQHAAYTPLHFAVDRKNLDVARLLIERDANVKAEDLLGDTPLHVAVKRGFVNVQLITLMLRHGADINAKNAKGTTPLECLFTTEAFTLQQFDIMLCNGAVIDVMNYKSSGDGILGLAISNAEFNDRPFIFNRIINGCDLENVIKKGFNVIDSAVNVEQTGNVTVDFYLSVLDELIDAGCNVDQKDQEGKTALHRAVSLYNYEAVKALLLVGANLNAVDKNGESPITKEVMKDDRYHIGDRKRDILHYCVNEIRKMSKIKFDVNESIQRIASKMTAELDTETNRLFRKFVKTGYQSELNRVTETSIDQLALIDFLSDTGAIMRYSKMSISKRQAVDAFFKRRDKIRQNFPEWAGLLIMQYRKAVARVEMLKPAIKVIFSAGIKLSPSCLKEIVEHLNYDELQLLVGDSYLR